ncbi:MAG: HAD family hydrolase [Candidatus Nezhaarchaeota archaeon]|nr:HAD family hydrolase [Candidatus Nezhaarchaeota archaeon]
MRFSAVLFDLGGTLVGGSDTREAFMASVSSLVKLLKERGFKVSEREVAQVRLRNRDRFNQLRKTSLREVVGEVWMAEDLRSLGIEPSKDLVAEALKAHCEAILEHRFVYDDALRALEELSEMRVSMAVVSNASIHRLAEETLRRLGLSGFFKILVTSAQVGWRKPHPAMFIKALEGLGVSPSEAAFVGDDPVADIEGARGVGIEAVLIERRPQQLLAPTPPRLRISSLSSLTRTLSSL